MERVRVGEGERGKGREEGKGGNTKEKGEGESAERVWGEGRKGGERGVMIVNGQKGRREEEKRERREGV